MNSQGAYELGELGLSTHQLIESTLNELSWVRYSFDTTRSIPTME